MGPCEEEQVHYVFFSQPGSVDEKSVLLLPVRKKKMKQRKIRKYLLLVYILYYKMRLYDGFISIMAVIKYTLQVAVFESTKIYTAT